MAIEAVGRRKRRERTRPPEEAPPAPPPARSAADRPHPARRPAFAYLDDDRVERIGERALALLERHGVRVDHPGAPARLAGAGARLDADGHTVRLPRALVEEALAATPKSVTLWGKRGRHGRALPRGDGTFHMRTGTGAHAFVDPESGQTRPLVLADVATIGALGDGLGEVAFVAHPFVNDAPPRSADLHALAALLARTEKHVWIQPYEAENVGYLMRLAVVAAGGEAALRARPIASCIACSFTPLTFKAMDVTAMVEAARFGVPIHACSLPTAGGTAPATMPGTVLMAVAEILAMATMVHVLGPGTPVIATPLIFALDMRSGRSLQASVEAIAGATMAVQVLRRRFGLMTHTYGAGSDGPAVDARSQTERSLLALAVGLAGADVLGGVGQLACATAFSPVQAVLDDEIGAMVRAYLATPEVDDESLAWALMQAVPAGGDFIANPHTLAHCREAFVPGLFAGEVGDVLAAARERVAALVGRAAPEGSLSAEAVAEMAEVVAAADRDLLG